MDPHFDGIIFQTHASELARRIERPFPAWCAVDVRSASDYAAGHLPGAISASAQELTKGLPEDTAKGTEFFVIGAGGGDERVRQATDALRDHGAQRVVELGGGMAEWDSHDLPVEQGPSSGPGE